MAKTNTIPKKVYLTTHDRLHDNANCRCPLCSRKEIYETTSIQVYDEQLHRVVKQSQKRLIDNKAFLRQFRATDFSLDTLIATGALASMSHATLSGDRFASISAASRLADSLDATPVESKNE